MKKGTLHDAIDAVSTIDIVEAFDVPNKTYRGRTYLICPGHDDKSFGSCYIDKNDNGYYCYACGEHVDKWSMVLKLNGGDKSAACNWFFKTAGMTPSRQGNKDKTEDDLQQAKKVVKSVGEYLKNNPIYNDIYSCEKIESSYGRNINGEYMYSEQALNNPLLALYKENKSLFKEIVLREINTECTKISNSKKFFKENLSANVGNGKITFANIRKAADNSIEELCELIETIKNTKE